MGVRFNKRINIFSWLKLNVGKSGISATVGPKGKTLNIGSTGVNVNVSLGKGVGYSKRLITWKKLNLLSILGLGGAAAAKKGKKGNKGSAVETTTKGAVTRGKKGTTVPSLDEAIAEAEAEAQQENTQQGTTLPGGIQLPEQQGCSWGCAILGCLGLLIVLALLAVIAYFLWQQYGATSA
ncbi:MAG: DUF4236 domain-containing protein [Bacteroidaceae bacterium]|nr:DUF4236 domain-containing protein [Bacteroidaceae bacterium]